MIVRVVYVRAAGSGAPEAAPLPGAERRSVDAALLRHAPGFLLPPLHPALQKQQVPCKQKTIQYANTKRDLQKRYFLFYVLFSG